LECDGLTPLSLEGISTQPLEAAYIRCSTFANPGSATSSFQSGRQAALKNTATL